MSQPSQFHEPDQRTQDKFVKSWDLIVDFYDGSSMRTFLGNNLADLMVQFVKSMQSEGYNRSLRAGQVMHHLVLSRSREHGSLGRCHLSFDPEYGTYEVNGQRKTVQALRVSYRVDGRILDDFAEDDIVFTDRIRTLLQTLSAQPLE
ncbi:MAG: hypothetical protein SFW36_16255 [Leptolyngbyaceae cyanobacterium bins.59]|nr:hypothetical protein [Leptolyngbyaceae cyanobacterium bins.59]